MDLLELRNIWGASHFVAASQDLLTRFQLARDEHEILATVGLPVGPAPALHLDLRFESVDIRHRPTDLCFLSDTTFQPTRFYPQTGDPELDEWVNLDRFVVLGEVPNDFGPGGYFLTRFVCLDKTSGRVCWVYLTPSPEGRTDCCPLNSSLAAYLASLLAYKRFRDHWPTLRDLYEHAGGSTDDPRYRSLAERIHAAFLRDLQEADVAGFKDGFWERHAWDEAILLEL